MLNTKRTLELEVNNIHRPSAKYDALYSVMGQVYGLSKSNL